MAIPVPEVKDSEACADSPVTQSVVTRFFQWLSQKYQYALDVSTPLVFGRWSITACAMLLFIARIFILKGFYIITYALGIYYLSLLVAFLSPKIDPAIDEDYDTDDDDGPELPKTVHEEFRPFIRRLPEFKFWFRATRATCIAIICTYFSVFNIPVFWPILLLYFIILFTVTMKRQIKHMIKYRYLPWTTGKAKYKGKEDTGKIVSA